jgi:hypothetical protein
MKPRLKFTLCGNWMTNGYAFPATQYATVDLRDPVSKSFYSNWYLNEMTSRFGDTKACYIAIGIKRGGK